MHSYSYFVIKKKYIYGSTIGPSVLFGKQKKANVKRHKEDFPGGPVDKNPSASAEDTDSTLGPGRFQIRRGN